jgi:hypothetical protein
MKSLVAMIRSLDLGLGGWLKCYAYLASKHGALSSNLVLQKKKSLDFIFIYTNMYVCLYILNQDLTMQPILASNSQSSASLVLGL